YVNLDELMEGVGKRLAEQTGAEWGIVTAGCAAAITHVTAACIAGSDPEKMQRLPNLHGLKSEVIIPQYSRNEYDHAVRMLGVKCIRGPQCAGLALGEKSLLQAAWLNSAPHHAFGRSLKVGKEEIMGMLAAVEAWTKRDHKAEWTQWESWLDHISKRVTQVAG